MTASAAKHNLFCPDQVLPSPLSLPLAACWLAVTSVLAIGGIGGLAIGLAGREICENLLNGFLIMSTVSRTVPHLSCGMSHYCMLANMT